MNSTQAIKHEVRHYVVRNVIATMGMSLYVIIDTLFISIAAGALGLTTLNLVLPLFNVFNGVGLLLASVGPPSSHSTRFFILSGSRTCIAS